MEEGVSNRIICVGAIYIDTILSVPHYPKEDEKVRATKLERRRGGNCGNTLEILEDIRAHMHTTSDSVTRPDIELYLISVLPSRASENARFIHDSLQWTELDKSCIYRDDVQDAASSYIVKNEGRGSRTIVSINQLAEMTLQEFVARVSRISVHDQVPSGWYHFEGRVPDITLKCVRHLCQAHEQHRVTISVELEKPQRSDMVLVAKEADMVFYSRTWIHGMSFDDPEQFLQAQVKDTRPNATLIAMWGSDGATAVQKSEKGDHVWASVRAWRPPDHRAVVDPIGAGDTFIAGMLWASIQYRTRWTLKDKIAFANELAGRKVHQDGFEGVAKQFVAEMTQPNTIHFESSGE